MIHQRTLQALEFPKVVRLYASFCCTQQGQKEALSLTPFRDADSARFALSLYEDGLLWLMEPEAEKVCPKPGFPDVEPLLTAIAAKQYSPDTDSFWAVKCVLNCAKGLANAILTKNGENSWPTLYATCEEKPLPNETIHALNRCISDDALIRDESSPELLRIRNEIRSLHQHCLGKVREFATKYNILSYLQDEFMTISQDRYVLPLKATYKGRLQGILHDWSQTGETCYFEPMFLVQVNNKLAELKREERAEEIRVLDYLAKLISQESQGVHNALALVTCIDCIQAKKRLADLLDAHTVHYTEESQGLHLLAARHPLLVAQKDHPVHPLDICLRPGDRCLLITGGNAGGKTVCLKTLGLVYVMTASGLPAPVATGSHLFWLNRLDAFIGDEQDVEDHVSTFTAQIEHLAKAWKYLRNESLVLLDEFGAGTDPTHGAALAQAVLESLLERNAYVMAATHFPTLKIWAMATEHVRAASMLFDPKNKRPLYCLAYDQVGQSQTLTVARDHGLAEEILAKAEKILLLAGDNAAEYVDRLNAITVAREEEIKKLKALQKKTEADAKNLREKLQKERDAIQIELNNTIATLMDQVKRQKMSAKEALTALKKERAKLAQEASQAKVPTLTLENLQIGQRVRHMPLQRQGEITAIDEQKERVRVNLGGISLWANLADLEGGTPKQQPQSHATLSNASEGFTLQIDVRGETQDAAIAAIQRFLDKNTLAGMSCVEIVHGRGTGVLRKAVHEYLKTYPGVSHFELAPEDQGGCGKTLVYFH